MHGEVAAGGACGDIDEIAAQRGSSGLGTGEAGQGPGGAQQVVRDSREGKPGRVGGNEPDST